MRTWHGGKWIRPGKRAAIYARDGHRCVYCGLDLAEHGPATLDHVKPWELGGGNEAGNLVTACKPCNSAKRDLSLGRFLTLLARDGVDGAEVRRRVRNATRRVLRR